MFDCKCANEENIKETFLYINLSFKLFKKNY